MMDALAQPAVDVQDHDLRSLDASRRWLPLLLVASIAGLAFGPLDLLGQIQAPYPFANLFNSPAVWAAAAFAFGWWAIQPGKAAGGAVVSMIVAVEGYYAAAVLAGRSDQAVLTSTTAMVWLVAGLGAGLIFGPAGALARRRTSVGALAAAVLPSVFLAEAVGTLLRLATEPVDGRPDDLGATATLLAVCGVVALVAQLVGAPSAFRVRAISWTVVLTAAGSGVYALLRQL